ncbi:hypothetical protein ES703_72700 [subsurface metagenome]
MKRSWLHSTGKVKNRAGEKIIFVSLFEKKSGHCERPKGARHRRAMLKEQSYLNNRAMRLLRRERPLGVTPRNDRNIDTRFTHG